MKIAPVDPVTLQVDLEWVRANIDANTVALIGSAPNYGYGTVDRSPSSARSRWNAGSDSTSTGCLGGFLLPSAASSATTFRRSISRCPASRPSQRTRISTLRIEGHECARLRRPVPSQLAVLLPDRLVRREVLLAGMDGSRSGGLLAATWAAMVSLGRAGYLRYAKAIFETSAAMQDAIRRHPSLRIMGTPSFLFSFTSDEFDIYLVNDFLRSGGGG